MYIKNLGIFDPLCFPKQSLKNLHTKLSKFPKKFNQSTSESYHTVQIVMSQSLTGVSWLGSNLLDVCTPGVTCAYQFIRGHRAGKFCPLKVCPGQNWCNTHLKSSKAKKPLLS